MPGLHQKQQNKTNPLTPVCLGCNGMQLNEISFNFTFSIEISLILWASRGLELLLYFLLLLAVSNTWELYLHAAPFSPTHTPRPWQASLVPINSL